MTTTLQPEILSCVLIDDNQDHIELVRHAIETALRDDPARLNVLTFNDPIEGLAELPAESDAIIFIDYQLAGSTGIEWISDFVSARVGPVIVLTSSGDEKIAAQAFREGASDYLLKDEVIRDPVKLRTAMREALRQHALEKKNRELSKQLKITNNELNRRNDRLRELTNTAHKFVDDVAHEFRTPLTVIKEFASIMDDGLGGEVTSKQREYLAFIIEASRDLAGLIDDFLNSSKLRANTIRVSRRAVPVEQLINSIWPMLVTRAAAKRIQIVRDIETDIPDVYADSDKAQRSLLNLVVNAIKFSDADSTITISAKRDQSDTVRLSVQDEGPGLAEEACVELFQRFRRIGEAARSESIAGFGLGLNIVKEMAGINLGEVFVKSALGEGSTFSFTLPVNERQSILDQYVRYTTGNSPRAFVSVLTLDGQPGGCDREKLHDALETVCYANDLILPDPDGCKFTLIGETDDYKSFRDRVRERLHERNEFKEHIDGAGIEIKVMGQWPVTQVAHQVDRLLGGHLLQEAHHA